MFFNLRWQARVTRTVGQHITQLRADWEQFVWLARVIQVELFMDEMHSTCHSLLYRTVCCSTASACAEASWHDVTTRDVSVDVTAAAALLTSLAVAGVCFRSSYVVVSWLTEFNHSALSHTHTLASSSGHMFSVLITRYNSFLALAIAP